MLGFFVKFLNIRFTKRVSYGSNLDLSSFRCLRNGDKVIGLISYASFNVCIYENERIALIHFLSVSFQ